MESKQKSVTIPDVFKSLPKEPSQVAINLTRAHSEMMEEMMRVLYVTGALSMAAAELDFEGDVICVVNGKSDYLFFFQTSFDDTPKLPYAKFKTRSISEPLEDREYGQYDVLTLNRGAVVLVKLGTLSPIYGRTITNYPAGRYPIANETLVKAYLTAWHRKEEIYHDYNWKRAL